MKYLHALIVGSLPGLLFMLLAQLPMPGIELATSSRAGLILGIVTAIIGALVGLIKSIWPAMNNRFTKALENIVSAIQGAIPGLVLVAIGYLHIPIIPIADTTRSWVAISGVLAVPLGLVVALIFTIRRRRREIRMANYLRDQGFRAEKAVEHFRLFSIAITKIPSSTPAMRRLWERNRVYVAQMIGYEAASDVFEQLEIIEQADDTATIQQAVIALISEVETIRSAAEEARERSLM